MKFSLFCHMERTASDQTHEQMYGEFMKLCHIADEGGLHAVWTGEHHGMDFTISPNPLLNLVDLAAKTKNIRLGTGTVVAPFWHPIKLAGELAMADQITKGRLEVGIARGAYSFEYERIMPGMDAWEAGLRMREIIPALRKLWQGNYDHKGEFFQFPSTTCSPKPFTPEGPPLWIAARDENSHEFAVENGCNVQVTPLWHGDGEVEMLMQRFNAAVDKFQPKMRPRSMVLQHAYVARDAQDSEYGYNALSRFYCNFGAWFRNERKVSQGVLDPLSEAEYTQNEMFSPAAMKNNLAIGTADEVIERIRKYEALGYDEFSFWIDSGMNFEQKKNSLMRFIDDVVPAFNPA